MTQIAEHFREQDFRIDRIRKRGMELSFVIVVDRYLYEIPYRPLERILAPYGIRLEQELRSGTYRIESVDSRTPSQQLVASIRQGTPIPVKRSTSYPTIAYDRFTAFLKNAASRKSAARNPKQEER